jgi:hypothetical protein
VTNTDFCVTCEHKFKVWKGTKYLEAIRKGAGCDQDDDIDLCGSSQNKRLRTDCGNEVTFLAALATVAMMLLHSDPELESAIKIIISADTVLSPMDIKTDGDFVVLDMDVE